MRWLLSIIRIGMRPMLLICLNGIVFAYAMFQGGFVSWFLFYGVFVLSLLSFSVMLFSMTGLKVERVVKKEMLRAGDTLQVELQVQFNFWNPFAYLQVEEITPESLRGYEDRRKAAFYFFTWRRSLPFSYTIELIPRGEHHFQKVEFVIGDMFGFFEKRSVYVLPETILVYPNFEPLEHWSVHGTRDSEGSVSLSEAFAEDLSIASVRHYVPGDRLMSIDWKQTARHNQLMTKEFDADYELEAFLVFCQSSTPKHDTFERSVELGASIIDYFSRRKLPLGLANLNGDDYYLPNANQEHYERMFRYFAKITIKKDAMNKQLALAKRRQHSMYMFITTSLQKSLQDEVAELIESKNHVVICYIQSEQSLPDEVTEQIFAWRRQGIRVYCFRDKL